MKPLLAVMQWRELGAARGRWIALLSALTLSVAAVVALMQGGERIEQAMRENYLATRPAHAQLLLAPGFDPAHADAVVADLARHEKYITAARLGLSGSTRLRALSASGAAEKWRPALLFSLPEPTEPPLAQGRYEQGGRPASQELWIERDARGLLGTASRLELPGGNVLHIGGSLHDPALPPASTEGVVYAYLNKSTLRNLASFTPQASVMLRFAGVQGPQDQARADALANQAALYLGAHNLKVSELRVPPLSQHPHQRQANAAVSMLLACAMLSALLCLLTATALLRGWLDGQRHALGVLKVLGAGRAALLRSSLLPLLGLTSLAALAGTGLGLSAGEALAQVSAKLLNLELLGWQASAAALGAGLSLGLLLPATFIALSIWRWAGQPAAVALAKQELQRPDALSRLRLPGPLALRMALRNVMRRRRRFLLASLLLAVAGAVFMGGLNLRAAWDHLLAQSAAQRLYGIELRFAAPSTAAELAALARTQLEVRLIEPWPTQRASFLGPQGYAVSRAYPDGGHGQLLLRDVPAKAQLQRFSLSEGRWLQEGSEWVLNQAAAAALQGPGIKLGEPLTLSTAAGPLTGRWVGLVDEAMSAPTIYRLAPGEAASAQWRLGLAPGSHAPALAQALVASAAAMGLPQVRALTEQDLRASSAGHLLVLQRTLAWVALGTGLVGLVTLASALGSSVAERKQELKLLHALGASDRLLANTVMAEALLVVAFSLGLALLLGLALDPLLATRLGDISGQPLHAQKDGLALPLWAILAAVGGLLASLGASKAAKFGALRAKPTKPVAAS